MTTFDVAVFGRTVWDAWQDESSEYLESPRAFFGGPAANVAAHLSGLGFACTLVTVLGTDTRSAAYIEYLSRIGVDLSFAKIVDRPLPTCRLSRLKPGIYEWENGDNGMTELATVAVATACEASCSQFFADFPLPDSLADDVARRAACSPQLALWTGHIAAARMVRYSWRAVFLNEKEAARVASDLNRSLVSQSQLQPGTEWITTNEARPTVVCRAGEKRVYDVDPVMVISPVGAGDGFAAGVWAGFLKGWEVNRSIMLGHALARLVVRQVGCQLPPEVLQRLRRNHHLGT